MSYQLRKLKGVETHCSPEIAWVNVHSHINTGALFRSVFFFFFVLACSCLFVIRHFNPWVRYEIKLREDIVSDPNPLPPLPPVFLAAPPPCWIYPAPSFWLDAIRCVSRTRSSTHLSSWWASLTFSPATWRTSTRCCSCTSPFTRREAFFSRRFSGGSSSASSSLRYDVRESDFAGAFAVSPPPVFCRSVD